MSTSRIGAALALGTLVGGIALAPERAAAEDVPQTAPGGHCVVQGTARIAANVLIYDKAQGGEPFARFTGGETPLVSSEFPARAGSGRLRVQTGTGSGSFRIDGYTDATKLPVYTKLLVPVVPRHVWIGRNQPVVVVSASGGQLKVKKVVARPMSQSFSGSAACDSFTLERRTPTGWNVPGDARGYVVKKESIDLYDRGQAEARVVVTLHRATDSEGILLWSNERAGGWVHVEYHGEVVINAWARARDLQALPPGERMDELAAPATKKGAPRLALQTTPRVVTTTREVPIRVKAGESNPVIGRIEINTETYVLDVVAGWASVLPKSLTIAPHVDYQFWVKSSDLGL
jgi:hypothetical protein